jgi:hypothetical protein
MIEEENKAKAKPPSYLDPKDPRVKKAEEYSLRAIAAEPKYGIDIDISSVKSQKQKSIVF